MRKTVEATKQPSGKKEKSSPKNQQAACLIPAIQLKREKVCKQCGQLFEPKRCTSDFCSKTCYQKNYHTAHRNLLKVQSYPVTTAPSLSTPLVPDAADDMVSVKEVARRLKCSKQSIYNLINAGKINLIHFTGRLSFIRWSDILSYNGVQVAPKKQLPAIAKPESFTSYPESSLPNLQSITKPKQVKEQQQIHLSNSTPDEPEWCNVEYAMQCFHFKSIAGLYAFVSKHRINKRKKGKRVLYSFADIKAASIGISTDLLAQGYVSIRQTAKKYDMPVTTVYHKVIRHGIQTVTHKGKSLFLDSDFRAILTLDEIT